MTHSFDFDKTLKDFFRGEMGTEGIFLTNIRKKLIGPEIMESKTHANYSFLMTNHRWIATAEDPNAYNHPETVFYVSPEAITAWQGGQLHQMEMDASQLVASMAPANEADYYIKVANPISIPSATQTYIYDAVGNLSQHVDAVGNRKRYQYDVLDRLVEDDHPGFAPEGIFL